MSKIKCNKFTPDQQQKAVLCLNWECNCIPAEFKCLLLQALQWVKIILRSMLAIWCRNLKRSKFCFQILSCLAACTVLSNFDHEYWQILWYSLTRTAVLAGVWWQCIAFISPLFQKFCIVSVKSSWWHWCVHVWNPEESIERSYTNIPGASQRSKSWKRCSWQNSKVVQH